MAEYNEKYSIIGIDDYSNKRHEDEQQAYLTLSLLGLTLISNDNLIKKNGKLKKITIKRKPNCKLTAN